MAPRPQELTTTIVFRLDPDLHDALLHDADRNERTVSQSIRYHLRKALVPDRRPHP